MLTETGAQFLKDIHGIEPTTTAPGVDTSPEAVEGVVRAIQLCAPLEPTFAGITVQQTILTLRALRSALTASGKPLAMADGSSFADYLRNAVPEGTSMDEWTEGYETCKRRLAAILLPQLEKANG